MSNITFKLRRAIQAHGEEMHEISLRAPLVKDVAEIGRPFLIVSGKGGESGCVEIREAVVANWIVRLAGIPRSSVEAMDLHDYFALSNVVMGFFGDGDTETTTSDS